MKLLTALLIAAALLAAGSFYRYQDRAIQAWAIR